VISLRKKLIILQAEDAIDVQKKQQYFSDNSDYIQYRVLVVVSRLQQQAVAQLATKLGRVVISGTISKAISVVDGINR